MTESVQEHLNLQLCKTGSETANRGARLPAHLLPPYSPDLNPIEEAFSKIKNLLRKVAARSKEASEEVLGWALWAVSSEDARGFFEHAGYRPTAHLL